MLINCPECKNQISERAIACPHCGFPMAEKSKPKISTRKRRRKLPNGFGQITEIKGRNLSNPFRASVCVGKTSEGKCINRLLQPKAYFKTYNDAYLALIEYNKDPAIWGSSMTMSELYDVWSEKYFQNISYSTQKGLRAAWKYCRQIYSMKVANVRIRHIKACIEHGEYEENGVAHIPTAGVKIRIKSLIGSMLDYAVENEITDKNYARMFRSEKGLYKEVEDKKHHLTFSDEELEVLWQHVGEMPGIDIILVQCYSGWRPSEMGKILLDDVNLSERWFKGGSKTDAGKDRTVPIHSKIYSFVEDRYWEAVDLNSKYLFNWTEGYVRKNFDLTYNRYLIQFTKIMEAYGLNPEHKPHDCRVRFISAAKKYNVDEYAIKRMVGHQIDDVTEAVYTKRDFAWLRAEMEKIK